MEPFLKKDRQSFEILLAIARRHPPQFRAEELGIDRAIPFVSSLFPYRGDRPRSRTAKAEHEPLPAERVVTHAFQVLAWKLPTPGLRGKASSMALFSAMSEASFLYFLGHRQGARSIDPISGGNAPGGPRAPRALECGFEDFKA